MLHEKVTVDRVHFFYTKENNARCNMFRSFCVIKHSYVRMCECNFTQQIFKTRNFKKILCEPELYFELLKARCLPDKYLTCIFYYFCIFYPSQTVSKFN